MFRRATAGIAAAVLTASPLTACSAESPSGVPEDCEPAHQFETLEEGVLTISAYALPPYSVIKGDNLNIDGIPVTQGGELGGVDGDILAAIAANECLQVKVNSTAAAAVLATVQAGQADVAAANWFRTVPRSRVLDLSDPLYLDEVGIISRAGYAHFTELKDNNLKVGTVLGYMYVDDLRDYFGNNLVLYNSPLTMYQELQLGKLDAGVESLGVGTAYVKGTELKAVLATPHDQIHFTQEPAQATFPVRKGNTALLDALNDNIAELHASGKIADILEQHGLDRAAAETGEPRLLGE